MSGDGVVVFPDLPVPFSIIIAELFGTKPRKDTPVFTGDQMRAYAASALRLASRRDDGALAYSLSYRGATGYWHISNGGRDVMASKDKHQAEYYLELLNHVASLNTRHAPLGGGVERNYDFDGWTETPLQLFDESRWNECLHATIQAFNVNNDPAATQAACMDTGLLHELSHLACGIAICTHTSLADLRQRLAALGKGGA